MTPDLSCTSFVTLALWVTSSPTCLAKPRPIMSMPPTGWNMVVWNSSFMKNAIWLKTPDFRTSSNGKSSEARGAPFTPPPGARSKPRWLEARRPLV